MGLRQRHGTLQKDIRGPRRRGTRASTSLGPSPSWYMGELARYPLLSRERELEAAKEIRAAEIGFWREILTYRPALRALTTLGSVAQNERAYLLPASSLCELRGAHERDDAPLNCSRAKLDELAEAVYRSDVSRDGMRNALAWVRQLRPDSRAPGAASSLLIPAFQQRVRHAHRRQALAKQRFVRANLRLVVMIARQHPSGALPLVDLIQEGNLGLMTAVERFDPSRGFRFSTYASWWIRHAVRRALADKSRVVRVPVHRQDLARQLARANSRALGLTGSSPTTPELAKELGLSERKVRELQERPSTESWSLHRPMGEPGGGTFLDLLADHDATPPDEALDASTWKLELGRLLGELKPLEARILRGRFGLDGNDALTLENLGDELSLSRERVRQIQHRAMQQLRRRIEAEPTPRADVIH